MQQLRRLFVAAFCLGFASVFYVGNREGNATLLLVGCCVPLGIALSLLCLYALDKFKQRNN